MLPFDMSDIHMSFRDSDKLWRLLSKSWVLDLGKYGCNPALPESWERLQEALEDSSYYAFLISHN